MSGAREEYQQCLDKRRVFWVTDPGHGWLAVPVEEVDRLGIKPTGYSYRGSSLKGYAGYALLEEDCDAGLYFEAVHSGHVYLDDYPEFTFDQPSGSVAHNVRALDHWREEVIL